MAAVTICSDFRAQKNSLTLFPLFPHLFPMKWWDRMPWPSFSECWALSQLFHSPLSLSSRGFLVPLHFHKGGVICISEVIDDGKSKRVPEKHLFLLYWLCQNLWCVDHNKLWKILKEMGIPDHLTCLLGNLYACQEAIVRTGHGTTDWFQIGKRSTSRLYIITLLI